ncbi:MAG: GAF domain-containing protein [Melioribacteraceae bacterium]|nr:GAF domain-containing protein [Melioribacteraceae bacterium]
MEITIDTDRSEHQIYSDISGQLDFLIVPSDKIISNLSNFTALLKQAFAKISWVGFYISNGDKLFLGPFQGNSACTEIIIGNGVCGTSASARETIIVDDVDSFPGHIACDSNSKSEIVVPIIVDNNLWGVLDIDSYEKSSFSDLDKINLENFCKLLSNKLELDKFVLS